MQATTIAVRCSTVQPSIKIVTKLFVSCGALYIMAKFCKHIISRYNTQLPPGPRSLPVIGYLKILGPNIWIRLVHLASIYGPILSFRLGTRYEHITYLFIYWF